MFDYRDDDTGFAYAFIAYTSFIYTVWKAWTLHLLFSPVSNISVLCFLLYVQPSSRLSFQLPLSQVHPTVPYICFPLSQANKAHHSSLLTYNDITTPVPSALYL